LHGVKNAVEHDWTLAKIVVQKTGHTLRVLWIDGGSIVANFERNDDSNDDHSTVNDSHQYVPPKTISLLSYFPHDEHDSSLFRHGNWSKTNAV
jgi:hypothetical protein